MHAASITRQSLVFVCALVLASVAAPCLFAEAIAEPRPTAKVDFERHLMGLFGRMGCNAASCHGSFQGKGGLRLSLFGYDPEKDFVTLTRDVLSRRINPVDPERSLLLLKATGQVAHGGGRRFDTDSWQYQLFRDWVVSGARWTKGSGDVESLRIAPEEYAFTKPGETGQLRVTAKFADGTTEDITPYCDFRTNDDAIATVSPLGEVKALRQGDTAVIVSYRGNVLPVRILVPLPSPPGFVYPKVPEVNYIDRAVFAKLRRLNIVPADLASDAEFLRRVTIDTIGSLPSPDEVRAFLADATPDKRSKKIDELLAHPLHAALWATKFSDITGNNTDALETQKFKPKLSQMWHDWLRKRVADNMPYDEIVRGILCATSRDGQTPEEWLKQVKAMDEEMEKGFVTTYAAKPTLDLFWRRQQAVPLEQWGEKTAAAFLGVRVECAQCHKHPFDRWTQVDYRAHANIFGKVAVGVSPEAKQVVAAEMAERNKNAGDGKGKRQVVQVRELFIGAVTAGKGVTPGTLKHPETNRPLPAKALGGPEIKNETGDDPRVAFFEWLRSPENPFFARSFANRVWGHYFGVGVVDPVDNFSLANPPSNPKLLDALAHDFLEHKFDIRQLERTVLNSRAYQLASATNTTNKLDRTNYSHSFVRSMMAEVVVDVLNTALGTKENFGADVPPNCRAIEIGSTRVANGNLAYALRIFGRSPRTSACDCERTMEPALPQTLYRMTDPNVQAKMQTSTRLQELLKANKSDEEVLDDLFLATLTRFPTAGEKQNFMAYRATKKFDPQAAAPEPPAPDNGKRAKKGEAKKAEEPAKKGEAKKGETPAKKSPEPTVQNRGRQAIFVDVLWALINTREFLLNH